MLSSNDSHPNMGSGDHPSPCIEESYASTFKKVAEMINEQFDSNFTTPEMIEVFQEQFDKLDSGGTGIITKEDLANLYKNKTQHCPTCGDEIIDAIYTDMDYNEDGEVTFLDYAIFMTLQMKRRAEMGDIDFTRAFDMADKDGDGFVTKEDLRMSLSGTTIMDSEDADSIISQYDRDGKGTLNCEEYCEYMHDQGKRSLDYFCKPECRSQTMSSCVSLDSIFDAISVTSYESVKTAPHEKGDASFQKGTEEKSMCGEEKRLTTPVPRPFGAQLRIGELITDPDFEKACRENFDTLDSDKDGVLTLEDVRPWLYSRNELLTEAALHSRFREMNQSKSGRVDFKEFLVWSALTQFEFEMYDFDKCPELFKMFDRDGDGFISKNELGSIQGEEGMDGNLIPILSDEEKDEILAKYDRDGDGKLNYDEFMKMIESYLSKSIL